ncbi:MAG: EAL domain-containing response regulator [Pseudomonadota bacterium]
MKNNNVQILVLDDESFVLNLSVRILDKLGYSNVQTAGDGSYGLSIIELNNPPIDVVICDLNMPETDGIEFMRRAHENGYRGALIFLSGEDRRMLDTALDLAHAHDINVLGAIEKPLKPDALQAMLGRFTPAAERKEYAPQQEISRAELEEAVSDVDVAELVLFYQPKLHVKTGVVTGVEALARWHHSERGLLGPGAFIPLAEKEGLINELSFAIYRKAVQQAAAWQAAGINLTVAINFSINTFSLANFPRFLIDTAEQHGVSPSRLMLEVTETQVMQNVTSCQEVMMRLRMKKFGLSVDDFGTGNSSLVQLKNIPFTELKIDRAFVHGAATNTSARAILETSVDLARRLGMQTVAEGAETEEDWNLVLSLGVDYVQGYYVAKPMPAGELQSFVAGVSPQPGG